MGGPDRAHSEPGGTAPADVGAAESYQERIANRSERRDAEARARLEPLTDGERPAAVTAGAIAIGLLAIVFTVSAALAATGSVEIRGAEPSPVPLGLFAVVLWVMARALWRVTYWAVLGLQMLLVLFMISAALGLVAVETFLELAGALALLGGSGTLFYLLIRVMARLQMPSGPV